MPSDNLNMPSLVTSMSDCIQSLFDYKATLSRYHKNRQQGKKGDKVSKIFKDILGDRCCYYVA